MNRRILLGLLGSAATAAAVPVAPKLVRCYKLSIEYESDFDPVVLLHRAEMLIENAPTPGCHCALDSRSETLVIRDNERTAATILRELKAHKLETCEDIGSLVDYLNNSRRLDGNRRNMIEVIVRREVKA